MKQYITKVLKFFAGFLLVFPGVYIVLAGILFDIPLNKCIGILFSPFYYFTTICAVIAGYGLWEMRRWSWYFFVAAQVLVGYENVNFVLNASESHHKIAAYLVSIILQLALIYRVALEVRVPYFFPRIRWWESNPRYRFAVPVVMGKNAVEGEILDLSLAGCFIKTRGELKQDEVILLKFEVFSYEVQCEGTAVWLAQSTVTHPKGVGIKFCFLTKVQKRALRNIQKRLKKISSLYRRSRYWMNPEEFNKHLDAIETSYQEPRFMVYKSKRSS